MKRAFDVTVSFLALLLLWPLLAAIALLIWAEDRRSPLFLARRVAQGGGDFQMMKFRTMIPDAWKSGVNSTAAATAASPGWAAGCVKASWTNCRSCGTCSQAI